MIHDVTLTHTHVRYNCVHVIYTRPSNYWETDRIVLIINFDKMTPVDRVSKLFHALRSDPLEELTALHIPLDGFEGPLHHKGVEGRQRGGKGEGEF